MNLRLFFVFYLSVTLLLSCSDGQVYEVRNDSATASGSTLLCRSDSVIKVFIGDRIAPTPLSSQMVEDEFGKLLSETPIQQDYKSLNLHNVHVVKDGLLIQKKTSDENVIEFVKFVLKGYEN